MADQITNYQCPSCGGPLRFSEKTGMVVCDHCGSQFSAGEVAAYYADKDEAAAQALQQAEQSGASPQHWDDFAGEQWDIEGDHLRVYSCPSCGAELVCTAETGADSCPYCGNKIIVPGQFSGMLKPDYIIPFKLGKEEAIQALKGFYRGKKLLPKNFADQNHIEKIQGVYVPFWLFNGFVDADLYFDATRSRMHMRGQSKVITTEHFKVHRAGRVSFEKIPADGSSAMPDEYMDAIEPFDYDDLKQFSTGYLPGFLANKYDLKAAQVAERAEERAAESACQAMANTISGYDSVSVSQKHLSLYRGKVEYALLPVWLLSSKWNGQNFLFAMNGQTGRMIGKLPVSRSRYWAWFMGIAIPVAMVIASFLMMY